MVSRVRKAFPDTHIAEEEIRNDQDFIEDLSSFMKAYQIDAESQIAYIGSGSDQSARRVFKNTVHIDINKPNFIPKDLSFIQASAETLPLQDSSLDVALFKCFPDGIRSPEIARELNRVLKTNGIILSHGNIKAYDFSIPPNGFKETQGQNQTLRQLINLLRHQFRVSGREAHGLVELERGEDKTELVRLEKILERNRMLLVDQIRSSPGIPPIQTSIAILQEFGLNFGHLKKMSRQDFEKQLEPLKNSVFSPFYAKIVNELLEAQRKDELSRQTQ
jgi:SAM-dependent methyltransferase